MTAKTNFSQFDALDHQIIQELRQVIRPDAAKIARVIGANERTVRKRIDRLVAGDAIRLAAIVNPRVFNYFITVYIFLEVQPEHEEEIMHRFLTMPEVAYIAYGQGDHDIILQAYFKDYTKMRAFVRQTLPSISGISVTDHKLVLDVLRSVDEWMPEVEDFEKG
jgi:DNA-binding Lrp family transcriptional regulator